MTGRQGGSPAASPDQDVRSSPCRRERGETGMLTLGTFFRKAGRGGALRLKNGDAFAACADKFGITAREAEIIRRLIEGQDTRRITEALFISDHTVKNHIHNIYRKLGIRNRVQLVRCFQAALEETGRANGV